MNTIDEKVVSVDLENEGFVEGAEQTMSILGKLEDALSSLGSNISTRAFDTFTATIEDKVYGMEVAINTVIVRLTNTVYDAVANITSSINSVTFEPIYSGFAKYESQIASVQTMMTATGKSIDTVSEQLQKLMWFTDETSYSYTQMSDSVGKFVSAGVSLDDAVTAMIGIANWAGAAGANTQEASRAMYNLAQAMGKGNVTLQDWASINTANMATEDFKNALIDTAKEYKSWGKKYSEFVKQYGVDSAKFKEMAESNGHTVEEATKYYEYFNSAKLPKEFKSWSDLTPANLESTLSTKWLDSNILLDTLKKYGNYTEDLYKIYNQGDFDNANEAIKAYHDQYNGLIDKLYSIYREFGKNSKQFKDFVNENTMTMQTALDLVDTRSNQIFNVKLKKDAEEFAELAEKYGRESQNLADAAKKSGYTLSEALDIIDNGTKDYEKKEMSRGEEGFRKGQEAKTFTDAWGSAIEATSSQWLTFWQTVFGDYEEAKVTWTNLSNILWNVFAGPLAQLNEIADVWKELEGRTALLDSVKNIWNATQRLFEPIQNAFNAIFPIFSNVEQMGTLVSDLTNEFRKFTESLSISTNTFIYLRVIAESVFTVIKTVLTVLGEVRNAVWNIIQSALGGNEILAYVAELVIKIASISEYTDDISIKIAEVSGRIIGYISTIRDRFVTPLIEEIKNFFFFFTNQTDKIGVGFLEKLANSKFGEKIFAIKESLVRFGETLRTIKEQLSNVDTSPLVKLYNDIKPIFSNIGDTLVSGLLTAINLIINVLDLLARLGSKLLGFKDDWDSTVGIAIKNLALPSGLFDSIKEIFKAFSPIVDKIVEAVKGVISKVSEAFSKVDAFNAILAALVLGIGTLFSTGIQTLADEFWMPLVKLRAGISNFLGKAPEIFTSITGFIRDVVTEVGQYVNELPYLTTLSQYLRSIAGSLLMIAGAAVLFSTIDDPTKIVVIVGSMVAMVAGMTKILRGLRLSVGNQTAENVGQGKGLFGNFFGLNTELISLAAVFVSLGATMLLFSIAALNLSQLIENAEYPLERIVLILGTFGGMMLIMYLAVGGLLEITATPPAILKSGETANKAFLSAFNPITKLLRTMAMVMIPLGIMVKVLGSMDLWSIIKGVGAITLLMLALYTATSSLYDIVDTPAAVLKSGETASKAFLRAYNPVISLLRTMALVMVPLGIMVKVLGAMDLWSIIKGLGAIAGIALILYKSVDLLYKYTVNYSTTGNKRVLNLGKVALDLIPIALAIAMMAPPLILIGRLSLPDVLKGILGIVTIAGTLFGLVMGFSHLIDPTRIAPLLAASGALMMIAVAIGGMSATLIAIATLIPDKELQDKTLGTMVGMILTLVGTLFGIAVIVAGSIGEVLAGAGAMIMIAGAVSLFASAFAIIGTSLSSMAAMTGQDITEVAINSFVTTALMLGSLLGALDFLATMAANPKNIAKIAALAASMALIGLALDAVAFAFVSFSSVGENIIAGIFGAIVALTALGVFMKVMSGLVVDVPSMLAIGAGMAAIGAGLMLIAQAAKSFSEMSFGEILSSLVGLAAVMAVMAVISVLLINAAPAMLGVAIAILAIGAALIVLGLGIEAIKIAFGEIDFEAAGAAIKEFFDGVAQKIDEGIAKVKEYIDTLKQLPQTAEQSGAAFYHFVRDEYWDPEQQAWVKKTAEHDIEVGADPYRTGYMDYDTGKWVQVAEPQTYDPYYDYDEGKSYAYDAYNEIGEYGVAGYDDGMEGMADVSEKRSKEAVKASEEVFQVNSPSKVFKEIGYFIVEGFKEGTNGYKDVAKTDAEIYQDTFGKEINGINFDDLIFERLDDGKVKIKFKDVGGQNGKDYADSFVENANGDISEKLLVGLPKNYSDKLLEGLPKETSEKLLEGLPEKAKVVGEENGKDYAESFSSTVNQEVENKLLVGLPKTQTEKLLEGLPKTASDKLLDVDLSDPMKKATDPSNYIDTDEWNEKLTDGLELVQEETEEQFEQAGKEAANTYNEALSDGLADESWHDWMHQVGLSDESWHDWMHQVGSEHGKEYADGVKDEAEDGLGNGEDGFKVTIHNLKAGGLEDIDEWTQLGVFHGKQYVVSFLKEIEDGKESIRSVLMELGTYRNGKFTEGSYLAALDAARSHSDAALAEFNKWVETDEQGNVTGGIFNYANTGGTAAEQLKDWLDRKNKVNAKEVKKGLEAWAESLGLTGGISDYISKTISGYADKLGISGKAFGIEDAIESFKATWGSETKNGELDTLSFSSALDKNLEKLLEYGIVTKDNTDILNDNSDATKKATSATKSLSSAQSEYNSKVREFESIAKSYGNTVINLMTSIKNSITDMGGELSAEWADARGRAYATAFIAATNKAYDKARKEEKEAEEAERVTNKEASEEAAYILTQDRNVQARYANAKLADAKAWREELSGYKGRVTSITNSALAAVDQYNKTNRSGQIKAQRTLASETDPDYWRSKSDEVGSALQSLENEILDSSGYYKKNVTPEQRRLHETLLDAYLKIEKILEKYDLAEEKANQAYADYETVYTSLYDKEGDLYKEKEIADERKYYTDPKNIDKLYEDLNAETEYNRQLKEDITKTGLSEAQARQNRARLEELRKIIFDKYGRERFGVDPALKNEYNRLMEDTSGAVAYLTKIDESDAKIARLTEYTVDMEEEINENIERQSEEADYEASRSEANGEVTDQLFDLDKGQMKEARKKLTEENNELTKQINILNGRISELDGKTDERSKQERANLIADKAELEMQRSANKELIGILKNPEELGKQQRRDADVVKAIEEAMANGTIANAKSIRVFDTATGKYFDVTKSYGQPDDAEARKAITGMFDSIKLAMTSGKFDNSEFLESIFANADDYISLIDNPSWEYILSQLNDTDKIVNTIRAAINNGEAANTRTMTIDGKYITLASGQTWDDKIDEIINSSVDNIKNGMLSLITGGTETWGDVLNRLKRRQTNREKDINAVNAIGNPDILEDEGGEENNPYAIEETTESFAGLKAAADELAQSFKDAKESFKGIADTIQKSENNKTLGYKTNDPAIQYAIDVLGIKPPSESEYISQWEKKNNLVKVTTDNGTEKYVKADSEEAKNKEVATGDGHNVATIAEASKANANAARDIVEAKTKIDPIAEDTNSKLDALIAKVNDIYTNGVNYLAAMAEIQNGMDEIADSGIYLDSKTLIGKIAPGLDRTLGGFAFRRA